MARALGSPGAILIAWTIGAVAAFCRAVRLCRTQRFTAQRGRIPTVVADLPPALGFTAGWVSLNHQFRRPRRRLSVTFGDYLSQLLLRDPEDYPASNPPLTFGLLLIGALSILHAVHMSTGTRGHNLFTFGKLVLIGRLIVGGLYFRAMVACDHRR
jgi:hypothetical protein